MITFEEFRVSEYHDGYDVVGEDSGRYLVSGIKYEDAQNFCDFANNLLDVIREELNG